MYKLLYALPSNIEYVGLRKVILGSACASSNIAFLRPVYSILDGKASNIIQYIYICIHNCWKKSKLKYIWLEFGLFSTIIAIIRACACWALFVVTLISTVHLIYIYIYTYIYIYIYIYTCDDMCSIHPHTWCVLGPGHLPWPILSTEFDLNWRMDK